MQTKCARYVMIREDLYRRGFLRPLLKCVMQEQAQYIRDELHRGVCGLHSGVRNMASRLLREGYFFVKNTS